MRARNTEDITDYRAVDTTTLKTILSSGYPTAVKIGTAAGARMKIGRRVLWNVKKVQEYLDSISGGNHEA